MVSVAWVLREHYVGAPPWEEDTTHTAIILIFQKQKQNTKYKIQLITNARTAKQLHYYCDGI